MPTLHAPPLFTHWLTMCAANDDFVDNYNRLRGTAISFKPPPRSPIERMVDAATGHVPTPRNDPREVADFTMFCLDTFDRLPANDPCMGAPS